jgi:hypothetical protein
MPPGGFVNYQKHTYYSGKKFLHFPQNNGRPDIGFG